MVVDGLSVSVQNVSVKYLTFNRDKWYSLGSMSGIEAIKGVSFEVSRGDSVALLGKNGAGKSTLLSAIGGYLRPEKGRIETRGRVFTLKGANPGLIPNISSRMNVRLLAPIYGITESELAQFEDEVEKFCELGDAYDRQYKTLSSGMAGRVGFGFTTSLKPQILLMDETLGVGDENFRKKAQLKAENFMKRGETLILSTHSLNLAKRLCRRGLVLDEGKLVFDGDVEGAVETYLQINN